MKLAERRMTKDEVVGNILGAIALIGLPIVLGLTIYLSHRVEAQTIGQAREGEDRGRGIPLDDLQRAARHYGVTEDEILRYPECYPLPPRGYGL